MIRLEQVSRDYPAGETVVHALREVDLTIPRGDYLSIVGPSGAGKSTLLRILGLLDRPTTGRYFLEDREVGGLDDVVQARLRLERVGLVFQFFHLVPRLTAAQNLELPLILAGVAPSERRERVMALLEALDLAGCAGQRPDQLSAGRRQRLAIARATIMRPALLLADEPTGHLDPHSGAEIIELLESLNEDQDITLVVATQDPVIADRARRRVELVDGCIVRQDALVEW